MEKSFPKHIRRQWLDFLYSHKKIKSVMLFGSRARGDAEKRSDIDIAISAPNVTQKEWLDTYFFFKDDSDTLLPIYVVRWEEAPKKLKQKIRNEGHLIYERKKVKVKL